MSTKRWRKRAFFILVHMDEGAETAGPTGGFLLNVTGHCSGPVGVHHRSSGWTISHRVLGMRLVRKISTQREAFRIAEELLDRWGDILRKPKDNQDVDAIYHSKDSIEFSRYLRQVQGEVEGEVEGELP